MNEARIKELKRGIEKISGEIQIFNDAWDYSKSIKEYEKAVEHLSNKRGLLSAELRSMLPIDELIPHSKSGNLMTLEEFTECCECGNFIDYDGSGYYANSNNYVSISIYPSDILYYPEFIREDFTHVLWFNR